MRALILMVMTVGALAHAQDSAADRFKALPEAEKQALREKLKAFKQLPPEEKQRLKDNLTRFKALPTEDQERMAARLPGPTRMTRLETGHIPAVTHPARLAAEIMA